ncbi:hypothetical protein N825_15195 [Skermanella stibiiresistens SB22]|uniref:Auto-transporter adhesin head GIN domain-containing protein n=1 Tax=Skermanella stibiiresistens SB22 TaxID=1385369 RepID=W9GZQ9_9PROT|nr:hypothetical protein [Skermanella stibiiresistens]EWY38076.1 hypothetical protein N825_15195 [Skermanella stibiiresistens SB22]
MPPWNRLGRQLAAAVLTTGLVTGAAAAARDRASIDETFTAKAADLRGVAGHVHVRLHDGPGIRLKAEGPRSWMGELSRRTERGTLVVTAGSLSVASSGSSVNIASGFGARAVSQIGGFTLSSGDQGEDDLPEVELWVPRGTPLTATGMVGDWEIGDLKAPVRLDVSSGRVTAGAVTDGDLSVHGGGTVAVARVDGDLDADLAGAGGITVGGGKVGMLKASITGTGSIRVQAPVERADLSISGIGSIDVDRIREEPTVRVSGLGTVRTGSR